MNKTHFIIIVTCVVLVLAVAALGVWSYTISQSERELQIWKTVENTHDINAIQGFLDEFPDGQLSGTARATLQSVRQEIDDWNQINNNSKAPELQRFMEKYPSGKYHDMAAEALALLQENNKKLHSLMRDIEQTFNSRGVQTMLITYGTTSIANAYKKACNSVVGYSCFLLQTDCTEGYTTIKGEAVTDVTSSSCKMKFTRYYNGPDERSEVDGHATFFLTLDNGKWVIRDIEENGYPKSFMQDPNPFVHYVP